MDVKVSAPTDGVKNAAYGLKAEANDGIYITNSNGDLYLDSVISKNGDVVLTTNGSFIDNNFTDIVDKDAAEKLTAFTNAQVLENQKTTANLQKQMLVNSAQNKYNRYQALKKYIVVDEDGNISFNLTDLDRAALEKAEFDEAAIQQYVADRIAEYKDLVNQGADNWTETALTSYKDSINNTDVTSNIMAKASLSEDALQGHRFASENGIEFLTVEEKAEILVGSARSQKELLVSTAPGTLKEVTDTNLIIKTVPNVKGKNVTLTATGDTSGIGSVKEMSGVIPSNIDEILIKNSDEWTEADKQAVALYEAYLAAERGDVTKYVVNDDGSIDLTVKVVDSIDITASGAVNVNAPMHVYLTSEADVRLDTISSNGEVRLKANGSIIGTKDEAGSSTSYKGTVTSGERVVLESAQGSINGITLSEATNSAQDEQHELIARAAKDISISKADDLVVDIVHSANGKVTLDVGGEDETANNITAYGSDENGNEVNISGVNIELLGVDDLGEATNNIGLKGRVGKDVTDGKITATVAGEVYIDTFGNINNPEISGQAIDHLNLGSINGGEVIATATNINLVNKGSIIGTSFVAANGAVDYKTVEDTVSEDVTINAGSNVTVDAGDDASFANITAQETVDIDGEANVTVNEVTAQNLNVDVNKDITIGTADVQQEATLNSGSNITADTVTAQNLDVNAGNTFKGNNISAVDVNIVAGKDIIISSEDVTDSLAGVVDNDPATFIGSDLSAGHLTAELRKDYTTFADDKGNGVLSATGKLNLQAGDSVAIDTLLTEDNVAQIKANIVGIDDAQNLGTGATEIQVNGSKGEAAYYVGIGTSDNNTLQLSDSNVEQLVLNAKDNVQVKNTYVNGDGSISAGKVLVGITNNPHNEYSLKIGELTISDDEVTSSEKFAYVLDGIDLNGSHRTETKVRVSERSLFTNDDHSSKQAEENEKEESKIKDTSITFGTVSENEAFQKI